jgi:hypothetical protein
MTRPALALTPAPQPSSTGVGANARPPQRPGNMQPGAAHD